jgi:anti-anti-sigma factor
MDATHEPFISTERTGSQVVIRLKGDLDFTVTEQFEAAVESAVDDTTPVFLVDCEEVTFIDSESLKAILRIQRKLNQSSQDLRLRNCSKPVLRIVSILGLEEALCRV